MNVNPIQLLQLIKNGSNPQQVVMSVIQQQGKNNPIIQNATNLARNGNASALETIARNLAQQKGLDFDTEFANFKNYLK
jgi:hypothetical protein